jgi:hypothetical protein
MTPAAAAQAPGTGQLAGKAGAYAPRAMLMPMTLPLLLLRSLQASRWWWPSRRSRRSARMSLTWILVLSGLGCWLL